jgi:hypothetical protein
MKKPISLLFAILMITSSAHALFEVRLGYGVQTPAEDQINANTLSSLGGFNFDGIVELPLLPFGFGLRYESLGSELDLGVTTVDTSFERTSLLINYRFIDLFAYFGVIGTIGFVNDFEVEIPNNNTTYDASLTYSAGVEGGVSLGLFMVGAELGYIVANLESNNTDADLSGVYAKALVGVGF